MPVGLPIKVGRVDVWHPHLEMTEPLSPQPRTMAPDPILDPRYHATNVGWNATWSPARATRFVGTTGQLFAIPLIGQTAEVPTREQ